MGIYRILARSKAGTGLYGYQQAGRYFEVQAKQEPEAFLKRIMSRWFQWPEDQANQLIDELKREGKLEEETLCQEGISLKSPDGSEEYLFRKNFGGNWSVKRVRPDKPILKN